MSLSIAVPPYYGYVILTTVVGNGFIVSQYLGTQVMAARSKFNVPYPNLYATPGFHKDADAFNRVQRGHQATFELLPAFMILTLLGGLKFPLACVVHSVLFAIGNILFLVGYADTALDAKHARYKKGGGLKWVGFFGSFYCAMSFVGSLNGWW